MSTISSFARFGKRNGTVTRNVEVKTAVVYTRVSSKEQADKNLSLDFQRKVIEEYAKRNSYEIAEYFGGTYESAKSDGRKEFQRMLDFIKRNRNKVSHILVYTLDRFSRTGGGAIKIAEELREKYGVTVFAVTQPADTSNPSGVLQQSIHFIFSQYDNQLRKQRAVAGMKEKFSKGIWVTRQPMGYDIVKTNGERKIVVNAVGKKLRKAFIWKSEGMKNEQIIERLNTMGVAMYKQQLTKVFKNPFYCGLVCHGILDGKVVEGTHEKLISQEIFLKVNKIHEQSSGYGVPHKKEQNQLPLKVFIKCGECGEPFTGYVVKAKGLWYYKCRKIGCKCNKSAKEMHSLFGELLSRYSLEERLKAPLMERAELKWYQVNKDNIEREAAYRKQLVELDEKIENVEEGYFVTKEMGKETFDKFYPRYVKERDEIADKLADLTGSISNGMAAIEKAIDISIELNTVWVSSGIGKKEKLQKLLFPHGIVYDRSKGEFRTDRVNSVFELIAELVKDVEDTNKGQTAVKDRLSLSAERQGFEPWIPFDRYTHFPGVPLQPLEHLSVHALSIKAHISV
jgi:site-specific DNA recombinase